MAALCHSFLNDERQQVESGELFPHSREDYRTTPDALVAQFRKNRRVDDLRPEDVRKLRAKWAKRFGTVSLKNEIDRARVVLKYAAGQRLIERPVHDGQSFDRPSAKAVRKARNDAGPRLFAAEVIRRSLDEADLILKAMVLLGMNARFGNGDVGTRPESAVDPDAGWIEYPRPKTEIPRKYGIWWFPRTATSRFGRHAGRERSLRSHSNGRRIGPGGIPLET